MEAKIRPGTLLTFTGRPGSGKNTVADEVIRRVGERRTIGWFGGKSTTTRPMRRDDKSDEYLHVEPEVFKALKEAGEFAWVVENNGYFFGTLKRVIERALLLDKISILNLVPDVIPELHRIAGKGRVISVFLESSNTDLLASRMIERGSEASDRILRRLEETRCWSSDSCPDFLLIKNEQEDRPGETAASTIITILEERGCL